MDIVLVIMAIGFILVAFVVVAMMSMVAIFMLYNIFYELAPLIVFLLVAFGLIIGLKSSIKNTISVLNEVYFKK